MHLLEHQEVALMFTVPSKAVMVAFGLGCGKTAIAINTIMKDYSDTKRKSIVICPAYLALNWKAEFAMWWPEATVSIEGFKGKPSDPNATVIISSYERFEKVSGHLRLRRSLIVDEAHYLCGDSQRTKNIKEAAKSMKLYRLVLLTGTPMQNKVGDLYNLLWILDAVDDKGFRKGFGTKKSFQETFCEYTEMRLPRIPYPIRKYHGARNLDYLKPWLKIWWMRANIEDVVTLPGIQEEEITIHDIPEKLQKLLAQAWELQANGVMPEEDHKFGENVGEHISTAKANTAIAKAPGTAEFARDLIANGQGPIVVFTDHIQAAKDLFRMIDNDGSWKSCRCAVITGETPMAKRSDIVDKFQRGDLDCLVGTIGACSTGITLTRSNVCIMNDYAWNPGKNAQAVGRIYRISQKRHCHVYVMTGGDIDKDIMKQLREKMTIIKELENL
jgi:SNF2 family DNA or RNA helicase